MPQGERGGDVPNAVDGGFGGVRHSAPGVGRQRFDVATGSLRVEDSHRQRRLPRAGNPCDGDHPIQGNVDVDVREVVHARATHLDGGGCGRTLGGGALLAGHSTHPLVSDARSNARKLQARASAAAAMSRRSCTIIFFVIAAPMREVTAATSLPNAPDGPSTAENVIANSVRALSGTSSKTVV